jgi:hypothetical protein
VGLSQASVRLVEDVCEQQQPGNIPLTEAQAAGVGAAAGSARRCVR